MKKVLTAIILSAISGNAFAQGFYLRAGLGYAMPQSGETIDGTGVPYNGTVNTVNGAQTYNVKSASFSAGFSGTIGAGYMFSKYIGVDLSAEIGIANKKYTNNDNNTVVDSILSNISTKQYAKTPVILVPAIVVQTGGSTVNAYARFGAALGLNTKMIQEQTYINAPGTGALETEVDTWDYKSRFSVGVSAAIGVQYYVSSSLGFWAELNLLSMSVYTKEADLTNVSVDGQSGYGGTSYVSTVPAEDKVIHFDRNNTYSYSAPYQLPSYALPFSSIGLNVGIVYRFPKKATEQNTGRRKSRSF